MKQTKKLFSIVLAIALVFAMAIPAFAAGTGSITITNAVADHTYTAYKMLDFAPTADAADKGVYTIADGWEDFFTTGAGKDYFDIAADETVTLKEDAEIDADLAKAAVAYAKDNDVDAAASETAASETVELTGLDLGYYAVDTSVGTICILTNTNSKEEVTEKNSTPALEKKIVEGGLVDTNTVAIGDTVTYQATITVGKGAENYVMHDEMSDGLDYQSVVSVKVGDAVAAAGTDYVVKTSELEHADDCDFEIVFSNDYIETLAENDEIIVTYTAVLNEGAVVGSTGNPNEAWLEYGEESSVSTTPDIVITYTTSLTVNKTDKDGAPLEGAGFTLYKWDATIDANPEVEGVEGDWVVVSEIGAATGRTTFVWNGLDEGDYMIEETTVPAGYNKAENIEFTISADLASEVATGEETATWNEDAPVTVAEGKYATDVQNLTGGLLPETGGMGTTMFYMIGAMMVAAAVVLLVSKKRMAFEA